MAQNRLRDYKDSLGSFEHNTFNLGLHSPGRYMGFDTLQSTGNLANAMEFRITHEKTGAQWQDQINNVIGPCGVLLTPQGIVVQEDAPIGPLSLDTNAGNGSNRYDLVYFEHEYTINAGGNDGLYKILKGQVGSEVKPVLPNPLKQTAVAVIILPPGTNDIAQCTLQKFKSPDSGDGEDARITYPNIFKFIQVQNKSATKKVVKDFTYDNGAGNLAYLWLLENDGNVFEILPDLGQGFQYLDGIKIKDIPLQEGARISLVINEKVIVRESKFFAQGQWGAKGFRDLKLPPSLSNVNIGNTGGGSIYGVQPAVGEIWTIELLYYAQQWWMVGVGGVGTNSTWAKGDTIMYTGDINANFDDTGLGRNLKAGWQIWNGNNGTPDGRGKVLMMTNNVPHLGQPDLSTPDTVTAALLDPNNYIFVENKQSAGSRVFHMTQDQLPDCFFPYTDPGHTHVVRARAGQATGVGQLTDGQNDSSNSPVNTDGAQVGILIHSGGTGAAIEHVLPVIATVIITKL